MPRRRLSTAVERPRTSTVRDGSAEIERPSLSEAAVRAILAAEVLERETAAAEMTRLNRADRAEALRAEALLARRYIE